jgi:putative endonuclease
MNIRHHKLLHSIFLDWIGRVQRLRNRSIGRVGECLGMLWLISRGNRIVKRNLRLKRGEIDLLIHDGTDFRIVEVRTITTHYLECSLRAFNPRKQRQVRKTAVALINHLRTVCETETGLVYVDFMGIQLNPWWRPEFTYLRHVEGVEGIDCTEYYSSGSSFTQ